MWKPAARRHELQSQYLPPCVRGPQAQPIPPQAKGTAVIWKTAQRRILDVAMGDHSGAKIGHTNEIRVDLILAKPARCFIDPPIQGIFVIQRTAAQMTEAKEGATEPPKAASGFRGWQSSRGHWWSTSSYNRLRSVSDGIMNPGLPPGSRVILTPSPLASR